MSELENRDNAPEVTEEEIARPKPDRIEELRAFIRQNYQVVCFEASGIDNEEPPRSPEHYSFAPSRIAPERRCASRSAIRWRPEEQDDETPEWMKAIPEPEDGFGTAFRNMLAAKGMTNVDCYHKANIDRKLYSKIVLQEKQKPRKITAISLILALSPTAEEMDKLLETLGYCLSKSNLFDLVISWCVNNELYNVDIINEYLDEMDLPLLGSCI